MEDVRKKYNKSTKKCWQPDLQNARIVNFFAIVLQCHPKYKMVL